MLRADQIALVVEEFYADTSVYLSKLDSSRLILNFVESVKAFVFRKIIA